MSDQHNIFVSHRHEDDHLVGELKKMLAGRGVDIRDSSITSETPNNAKSEEYIKSLLRDQIRWAGTVFVLVTPETKNHEWVDWEIEYAETFPDKRIIGIWAPDTAEGDEPDGLKDYADSMVHWDAQEILDALEGANTWLGPNGAPAPLQSISRAPC